MLHNQFEIYNNLLAENAKINSKLSETRTKTIYAMEMRHAQSELRKPILAKKQQELIAAMKRKDYPAVRAAAMEIKKFNKEAKKIQKINLSIARVLDLNTREKNVATKIENLVQKMAMRDAMAMTIFGKIGAALSSTVDRAKMIGLQIKGDFLSIRSALEKFKHNLRANNLTLLDQELKLETESIERRYALLRDSSGEKESERGSAQDILAGFNTEYGRKSELKIS